MRAGLRRQEGNQGFTLVELAIVMIIIAVLAAIAIPNFIRVKHRAREASVKANMHTLQVAFEDFAVKSGGIYPDLESSTTPSGETIKDICPGGTYPTNPFTEAPTVVVWDADPSSQGQIGANPASSDSYVIKGFGHSTLLPLELTSGGR